ncbi:hypothetical protein [Roseivivax marinus]|uniref:hypothetical protein n=1 Tax=Roseivivax marinus TaxID=1379903 RepID=UPI00273E0291|nr:hypothetical protein [Roseivivax marinus]
MISTRFVRTGASALALIALLGCGATLPGGGKNGSDGDGFRARYVTARAALEGGDYDAARRGYLKLIDEAGALAPRLRLEYAHTLLRAGDHARARSEAQAVAEGASGQDRLAALAVAATAAHELGLEALAAGERDRARSLLASAEADLDAVLSGAPDLDPAGTIAARRARLSGERTALR